METQRKAATILLVEDDANDVFLFGRAARHAAPDLTLATAGNGREAISYFTEGPPPGNPTVIVTDLKMPVLDGFAFLDWLQAQPAYRDIPVMVWSSSAEEKDVIRAYEARARAYLIKPPRYDDLEKMISAAFSFCRLHEKSAEKFQPGDSSE